jgi:hypothetical protein
MILKIIYCPVGLELDHLLKNKKKNLLIKLIKKKKIGKKKVYGKKLNLK